MAISHATSVRNLFCGIVAAAIDAGVSDGLLVLFQGASEVATLTFSSTSFGAPISGAMTANAITSDLSATGGTIDSFEVQDSDSNLVFEGTVGLIGSGADIEMTSVVVAATETVSCSAFTYTATN